MRNTNTDLKNHLFSVLEGLMDKEEPMELERAKVVAEVAQTMINATKSEIEFMELKADLMKAGAKTGSGINPNMLDSPFLEPKKSEDYFD